MATKAEAGTKAAKEKAATDLGQDIFDQIKNGKGWDDARTFEALADGGWSNGYVTVKSATQS